MSVKLQGVEHVHSLNEQACAITSVVLRGDKVWCGLTGGRFCLVPFDLVNKRFDDPVDIFPWVCERPQVVLSKIHNALALMDDGRLVIGEGILYTWDGIPFEVGQDVAFSHQNHRRAQCGLPLLRSEHVGPTDLAKFDMRCMTGGKILLYDPDSRTAQAVGSVQPFNYVQSMIVDPKRQRAYGHTLGDCHFFVADLEKQTVEDHGRISTFAFHNLVVTPAGIVYGAWIDFDLKNKLRVLRFDPAKGYLERLSATYLDDPGPRIQGNRGIDQWLVHSKGEIYVGMAGNGILYKFDEEKLCLEEIGAAGAGGRLTSLVEDEQGRVIFTGGFPMMHVGRYDPKSRKLEDFGPITDRYEKIYFHGGVYRDGTLYLAETDSGVASLWEVPVPD